MWSDDRKIINLECMEVSCEIQGSAFNVIYVSIHSISFFDVQSIKKCFLDFSQAKINLFLSRVPITHLLNHFRSSIYFKREYHNLVYVTTNCSLAFKYWLFKYFNFIANLITILNQPEYTISFKCKNIIYKLRKYLHRFFSS
jgi:hypothetical protein